MGIISSIDKILLIILVFGGLGLGFFLGVKDLSGPSPLWLAAMQSVKPQQRLRNALFMLVFGVVLIIIAILTFTYEQSTADLLTHLMGIALGILGFLLLTFAIGEVPKIRTWQLTHVVQASRFRLVIFILFFLYITPVLVYAISVKFSEW